MVFSVRLDSTTEGYLDELVKRTKSPSRAALVKHLIHKYWAESHPSATIIERMGGIPEHLLQTSEPLSDKNVKRRRISAYLTQQSQRQSGKRR